MKKILSNRIFMTVLTSDLLSNFGDTMYYMALMNYILTVPDSKLALSIVSFSEILPILSSLFTGMWSDRTKNKVGVIQATQLFRFGLYIIIGFAVQFTPALWIVILASVFNFLGDVAGQYENGLYIPISLRIVSDEDRQEFIGFKQSLGLTLNIFFQSAGAILVTWMTMSHLAWLNAGTFLLAFLIMTSLKPKITQLFKEKPLEVKESVNQGEHWFHTIIENLKDAWSELMKFPEFRPIMVIVPLINGIFSVISIIVTLIVSQNPQFVIVNLPTTLSVVWISFMVGNILGSILSMNLLKNSNVVTLVQLNAITTTLFSLGLFLENIYLMISMLFLIGISAGVINPKMQTMLYNKIPEEKLATVEGGISSYFQFGILVFRFVISGLILVLSAHTISMLLLIVSFLLIGLTLLSRKQSETI